MEIHSDGLHIKPLVDQPTSGEFQSTTEQGTATMLAQLRYLGKLVADIGDALGVAPDHLALKESRERLELTCSLELEAINQWSADQVQEWYRVLKTDLSMTLTVQGLDPAFAPAAPSISLVAGEDITASLDQFRKDANSITAQQGNAVDIGAHLSISKQEAQVITARLLSSRPDFLSSEALLSRTKTIIFYTTEAWQRWLTVRALWDWEKEELILPEQRTCIILCDALGYGAGFALEVIGAKLSEPPRWLTFSRAAWREFGKRAERSRTLHQAESHWQCTLATLTPEHLRLQERNPGLHTIMQRLAYMRAALSAAYLASTAHGSVDEGFNLRFSGPRPSACMIPPIEQPEALLMNPNIWTSLGNLAEWSFQRGLPDQLVIGREALARELPSGENISLTEVEKKSAMALEGAKADFVLYARQNSEQYLRLRDQACEEADKYAASVRTAVSNLTMSVVENLFRVIGLLLGVVIAGLFGSSISHAAQWLGSLAYVAYIGFILIYLLPAQRRRFHIETARLAKRLEIISELGERERNAIRESALLECDYFEDYYRNTIYIYWLLIGIGLAFLIYLTASSVFAIVLALPPMPVSRHLTIPPSIDISVREQILKMGSL